MVALILRAFSESSPIPDAMPSNCGPMASMSDTARASMSAVSIMILELWRIFAPNLSISMTPEFTELCIWRTMFSILADATEVLSASLRIWRATTANPRPNSPAFSASMEALSESRFVCLLTSFIVVTIPVIFSTLPLMTASLPATFSEAAVRAS